MKIEKFDIFSFERHYRNGVSTFNIDGATVTMFEDEDEYVARIDSGMPCMVNTIKVFDSETLALKNQGDCLARGNTKIGVWRTYDQFGEIIEEIDYDEGWKIGWEQLRPILISDQIDFKRITTIYRVPDRDELEEEHTQDESIDFEKSSSEEELDEEAALEEGKSIVAGKQQEKPKYDHVWNVTVYVSAKLYINAIYDGDTGERVDVEFVEIK